MAKKRKVESLTVTVFHSRSTQTLSVCHGCWGHVTQTTHDERSWHTVQDQPLKTHTTIASSISHDMQHMHGVWCAYTGQRSVKLCRWKSKRASGRIKQGSLPLEFCILHAHGNRTYLRLSALKSSHGMGQPGTYHVHGFLTERTWLCGILSNNARNLASLTDWGEEFVHRVVSADSFSIRWTFP